MIATGLSLMGILAKIRRNSKETILMRMVGIIFMAKIIVRIAGKNCKSLKVEKHDNKEKIISENFR